MYKAVQGVRAAAVRVLRAVRVRAWLGASARGDAGMATAEYAMGLVAAVAFAVVLYKVVTSGAVSAELQSIVKRALDAKV
ncbi:DUF4244 domain-containing protein [Streptomyces prunicolor]|uniref:DUF4244 domain-containing protein n=1 Tax=Streptomyces prunicolor TaxID=67348 RepID=UPI00342997C7